MATKSSVINWTTVISALLGLAGGALSGGFAAYTQLRTSQEQFSIERARMFQDLIEELQEEETARMALLNLWQLYPEERDQKIIVAAAIEIGQPDLVETIIGVEENILQLAELLHAKAASGERAALQTLTRVDPLRAARVMVDSIQIDIRREGDRWIDTDMVRDLKLLAQTNEGVVGIIHSKTEEMRKRPMLFDYLLYDAGAESQFIERTESAYQKPTELRLFNGFLRQANFKPADAPKIFDSARQFVIGSLSDPASEQFTLTSALVGLQNNSFKRQLGNQDNQAFASVLRKAVESDKHPELVREKALTLLREISRREAFLAIANSLGENSAGLRLTREIQRQLDSGLIAWLEDEDPSFKAPLHCVDVETRKCIEDTQAWGHWLNVAANR